MPRTQPPKPAPRQQHDVHHHFDEAFICLLKEMHGLLTAIHSQGEKIMSALSDFSDRMKVHNDAVDAAIAGLTSDVSALNAKIAELQNSAGAITPADQALLDAIESRASGVASRLSALDALTPPVAPATP